ncbi:MAG: bifunctional UDP-3-O-[3-hydroxymyristoyl] N-acetylglucosamine deacetylase/3-hydroxyacyl-ACP dehydratase [Gemmatimonadetes bacterium]|nr:bifunctional UDP-3-O-[3-hydroxymyristoyl] N-acetylglucosamine deacetylase/3-hydroxyacyl-ACP dehydratase [Gemmatimonadota bacterium]
MIGSNQRTIGSDVRIEGVGVHSGDAAVLIFRPAPPNTGIRFRRTDLPGVPELAAQTSLVTGAELGTNIGSGEVKIRTIEHVMAALAAQVIDNVYLDLAGPEPPIRDGSFLDFCHAIRDAGIVEQDARAHVLRVEKPVAVTVENGESYVAVPDQGLRISATIEFAHPTIGRQYGTFPLSPESFERELASARTFGFLADADALRSRGLARGTSLENTIVLDERGVLNDGGLRFADEFLRHKVGDILGDLALLGARLEAHVVAERPSHRGNIKLARAIADASGAEPTRPIVDAQKIMMYLPHRYPMLLVDRIIEFEAGKRIVGIKNVTINEPFFQGHYPGHPIMPGVLIIEAMAQVGGLLLMDSVENPEDKVVYFMSLDNVKWRRPVTPGDQIVFELEILQLRRHTCRMKGVGTVDGHVVAEAEMMARIVER